MKTPDQESESVLPHLWKKVVARRGFAVTDRQSASADGSLQLSEENLLRRHTDIDPRRKIRIRCQRIPLCDSADLVGMAFLCDLQFSRFQLHTLARISLVQSKPIPNLAPLSITTTTTTSQRRVYSEERSLNVLQQMAMTKAGVPE
jgi:hypothetical protein